MSGDDSSVALRSERAIFIVESAQVQERQNPRSSESLSGGGTIEFRWNREQFAGGPGRRKLDRWIDWALSHPARGGMFA